MTELMPLTGFFLKPHTPLIAVLMQEEIWV